MNVTKFNEFLVTLENENNTDLVRTAILGFDVLFNQRTSTNPYALVDDTDKEKPYHDADKEKRRPKMALDSSTLELVHLLMNKFNIERDEVRDHYLIHGNNQYPLKWLTDKLNQPTWTNELYFDDDENEFYGKVDKKYQVAHKNRYQNSSGAGD
jgi:hypothetical protein